MDHVIYIFIKFSKVVSTFAKSLKIRSSIETTCHVMQGEIPSIAESQEPSATLLVNTLAEGEEKSCVKTTP